jgi:hypothetical protein
MDERMVSFGAKQSARRVQRLDRDEDDGGGGSHGPSAGVPRSRTPTPPIRIVRRDSSYPSHATGPDFIEIAIHLRQTRPDIPGLGNGPFLLKRRVPGRKFVIAIADCGFPESAALANSGVAIHRHRDPAPAGRRMCWMPLPARARRRKRCRAGKGRRPCSLSRSWRPWTWRAVEGVTMADEKHVALLKQG